MVTLIRFARSSKDKLDGFTHLTLVHCPSRFLIVCVCLMCNTMIHLPPCNDGGLGSITGQSVSGICGGHSVTGTGFSTSTEVFPCHCLSIFRFHMCAVDTMQSLQLAAAFCNKQQCLSVCHLVMKKTDGLFNTDFKFIFLVAQESFQVVNWRAFLHILPLK